MSLLPNPYSKQGPTLTSQIKYKKCSSVSSSPPPPPPLSLCPIPLPLVHPSFSLFCLTFSSLPSLFSLTGSIPLVSFSVKNGFTALEVAQASDDKKWDDEHYMYDRSTREFRIVRSRHHDIEGVVELLSGYTQEPDPPHSHPVSVLYNYTWSMV